MIRSIELNWIAKRDKTIHLPNITYQDIGPENDGCYYSSHNNDNEILINDTFFDCTKV